MEINGLIVSGISCTEAISIEFRSLCTGRGLIIIQGSFCASRSDEVKRGGDVTVSAIPSSALYFCFSNPTHPIPSQISAPSSLSITKV